MDKMQCIMRPLGSVTCSDIEDRDMAGRYSALRPLNSNVQKESSAL